MPFFSEIAITVAVNDVFTKYNADSSDSLDRSQLPNLFRDVNKFLNVERKITTKDIN